MNSKVEGGGEGGLLTMLNILLVDRPCIQRVTCGSKDWISPIVLRSQHPFLVEENYRRKVGT